MNATLERWRPLLLGLLSFGTILVVWQGAVSLGLIKPFFVASPMLVFDEFLVQIENGALWENLTVSLYSLAWGLGLAVSVGGVLGVAAGWSRTVEFILDPFIWFKYSAPTIAFYPIFVAWLGLGTPTIIAISFLFAVTPVYANTLAGIKNVDPDLVRAARSFGGRRYDLFFKVALPGSIPTFLAGLRLAVGRALTGVVAAELFGATAGLGFSIAYHGQKLQTTPMVMSIVVIVLLGVVFTQFLSLLESKTDSWRTGPGR